MRSLKVTQENLDNQRDAVKEEKRLRYDNQPYINAFLRISELIFQNPHNAHSTIGLMEDLDQATVEDVREFFRIYYAPNNAVLSIVGDFESQEARALVERYFGSIPSQVAPPQVDVSEPNAVAQRGDVYQDKFAPSPAFLMGWKAPARRDADSHALSLASDLLLGGESSRLYQKLVKEDESVLAIQGGYAERRGPSSFYMFALLKHGEDPEQIRRAIMDEIRNLATEGPAAQEMEKLRNNLLNDGVRALQSTMYRAQRLAEFALYDDDPELINTDLEHFLRVTREEIKLAVARHLDMDNRTVLEIVPAADDAAMLQAASPLESGVEEQPAAPAPQVPPAPPSEPTPVVSPATLTATPIHDAAPHPAHTHELEETTQGD